jgi:peptide chain release factor 1
MEQISQTLRTKLTKMAARATEVSALLSDANTVTDQNKFKQLSKEYAQLENIVALFSQYCQIEESYAESMELLTDNDEQMQQLAKDDIASLSTEQAEVITQLRTALIPTDPDDHRNIYLEIRAGIGGDEAALFAGALFRMYCKYAEDNSWQVEVVNIQDGDHGGYKEAIIKILGKDVYSKLKFESGGHRVQRVPETESQGRIHTSACTVAVLPEAETIEEIAIDPSDIKVDTFRASGAGGQHVNTTDSAVRITHIPTGVVSECQDERSQHKNRAKAMSVLQAKILRQKREKQMLEISENRRNLVGSGDRSERIRTYNFPQGRITDHRINLTLYKLPAIIAGDLNELINSLSSEHQADLLNQTQVD